MAAAFAAFCRRASSPAPARPLLSVLILALLLVPRSALGEDVPVSENASRHFSEGVRYLTTDSPDRFQKAYREFKAAYADSPTWKILGNLGIVAQELERDGEAMDALANYLEQGGKDIGRDERQQVTRDLELLRSGHSTLFFEVGPVAAWIVDERLPESGDPVINRYGPTTGPLRLRVRAGHHRIRAERDGYTPASWEVVAKVGQTQSHGFDLSPVAAAAKAPAPPPASDVVGSSTDAGVEASVPGARIAAFIAFGVSAVGIGGGAWFLSQASQDRERADAAFQRCLAENLPGDPSPDSCKTTSPSHPAAIDAHEDEGRARTLAVVSFSTAGAALVGAGLLLWASGSEPEETALLPWIGPGQLGMQGRF